MNTRQLSYTPDGQIKSIRDSTQDKQGNKTEKLIATYQYNHLRQRIAKSTYHKDDKTGQIKEETTQYLWDKGLLLAEIKDDKVVRRYIYLNIMPAAVLDYGYDSKGKLNETKVYSVHTDHLGTPKAITNDKQETVWRIEMDIFGETKDIQAKTITDPNTNTQKPFEFNLRFAGQYFDQKSGHHYNYHRYYNPETGRYLTSDPIGLAGGLNSYGYANGRPYMASDVYGLYTVYWGGAGINNVPPYIYDQVKQLQNQGIKNVTFSLRGGHRSNLPYGSDLANMGFDAAHVNYYRHRTFEDLFFDVSPETKMINGNNYCGIEQINYIGYSFGSLLAAHTAIHYADLGHTIDNLVLIGSPISKDFLKKLQNHKNIKNVIIRDLTKYGDPIYAGMSQMDLELAVPKLMQQISGNGVGHFYYSATGREGKVRRYDFAMDMKNSGLK